MSSYFLHVSRFKICLSGQQVLSQVVLASQGRSRQCSQEHLQILPDRRLSVKSPDVSTLLSCQQEET